MRIATLLSAVGLSLLSAAPCDAGGFFRRVPEVGEWARYEFTLNFTAEVGKPVEWSEEFEGVLLLQCVGEELIDDRRHLWIELYFDMKGTEAPVFQEVTKLLVPEEELLSGELSGENVRGWRAFQKSDPDQLTFSSEVQTDDTGGAALLYLVPGAMPESGRMSHRTVVVNEQEAELNYSESAPLPTVEYENVVTSGKIQYWPHADLGFGVASCEYEFHQRHFGESPSEMVSESRYDLVASGTDAVSRLPDHN